MAGVRGVEREMYTTGGGGNQQDTGHRKWEEAHGTKEKHGKHVMRIGQMEDFLHY